MRLIHRWRQLIAIAMATLVIGDTVGYGAAPKRAVGEKGHVFVAPFNDPSSNFLTGDEAQFGSEPCRPDHRTNDRTEVSKAEKIAALTKKGVACVRAGKPLSALAIFSEIIGQDPANDQAFVNRGTAFIELGDIDEGIADYTEGIRLNSGAVDAWYNRGVAYIVKQDLDRAARDLTEVIRLNPSFAPAYCSRGLVHQKRLKPNAAMSDLTTGIILDGGNAFCYFTRGNLHFQTGQYRQAIDDLSRGLDLKPRVPAALGERAKAYELIGEPDKALMDYDAAREAMKAANKTKPVRKN